MERWYAAIDLKSFYASVECLDRGLDPLTTNLVVADNSRTDKTICLAVSPSLKALGVGSRPRLFEVKQRVREVNAARAYQTKGELCGSSWEARALEADPTLAVDYIVAPPRMARYIEYSTRVYQVYLRYAAPEDIHVYSIDEVFIDVTAYVKGTRKTPHAYVKDILCDVLSETGVTATAGIGTNLYLAKVAMDILAKKSTPDEDGVRIAQLDEQSYREQLWSHRPLTDFWRIGRGYAKKLESHRMFTMGDVARCSLRHEWLLYKLFGVNAELLIDHAWGWEPCTLADIKAYQPRVRSTSVGQVLTRPYTADETALIVREMAEQAALDLVAKRLVTDQLVLTIGYDIENIRDAAQRSAYDGAVVTDFYGRTVPKHANGTVSLGGHTSSSTEIVQATMRLLDRILDKRLLCRRIQLTAAHILREDEAAQGGEQLSLFEDASDAVARQERRGRERRMQDAVLAIRAKYGKNAVFKGMDLEQAATALERNRQIGGHKA